MKVLRPKAAALALAITACSSSGNLRGNVYSDGKVSFRIGTVPSSWRRLDVDFARLAFRDEAGATTVLVNARCGNDDEDIPLKALTQQLFMTFTEREVREQTNVPMDGREALHTLLHAKLDGVPKMFDVYVLKKDGCVYDFVYISPPETFEASRREFERFVSGFHAPAGGP